MKTLYFFLVLTICSCRAAKVVKKSVKETIATEKKEVKKDSISVIAINKPINDVLTIPVVKSNTNNKARDSVINTKVDEILSRLNTAKKSGKNNYKLYYDLEKRLINLQTSIGETKDTAVHTKREETTQKTFEQKTDEYISKKINRIPIWIYALVIFWFFPQIFQRVKKIINPIASILKKRR